MTRIVLSISTIALAASMMVQAQTPASSIGIIHIQEALISTEDGNKAVADLQTRFEPTSKRLEGMQNEIVSLKTELNKGSNTMSEERRREIARDIDQKTRSLNRATEDAQAEFQQAQDQILQNLGQRMMAIINKYSNDKGYKLILDISSPQSPVLFAANGIDITQDVIKLYDEEAKKAASEATNLSPAAPAEQNP